MKSAFYINPKEELNVLVNEKKSIKPFYNIIKELTNLRRVHKKGTLKNLLYKELGNGIYGNVVKGMYNKMEFYALTNKTFRVKGTELSNPIIASWTTAFIRSVIGECLHNIQRLGGKVVSVTTDGFITDLDDLENRLLSLPPEDTIL